MDADQTPQTAADEIDKTDWDRPERWGMRAPWRPAIPEERRLELARHWLEFLDMEVTEKRIKKLKRHVMLYHPLSPKGQVTNDLVRQDKIPSRKQIEHEHPQWLEQMRERDRAQC